MSTDKDKLLKGARFMAVGLPFVFMGPVLLTWAGIPYMRQGNYLWISISILLMIVAAYFSVRGFRIVLAAFFDKGNDETS